MILTPKAALDVCYEAGFRWNQGIVVMPSIGWAESRLNTEAKNTNTNGTIDRGWLQINSIHVDAGKLSVEDCFDPLKAAQFAFKLSSGGTNFKPWVAFNTGAYKGPEGLVYLLMMAEWRDKAAREILMPKVEADLLACKAGSDALSTELAATRTQHEATSSALADALVTIGEKDHEIDLLAGSLGRMKEERDSALSRIDAAKVALG